MNGISFWTTALLLTVLVTGIWSCAHRDFSIHGFSWRDLLTTKDASAPSPPDADSNATISLTDSQWHRSNQRLQQALALYQKHNYSKAYEHFVQVVLETDDLRLRDKALLGAALSDLLLAQANEDITHRLPDMEQLFASFDAPQDLFSYALLEPFLLKLIELRQQSLSYQSLRAESQAKSRQINSLKQETARLNQQVEQLEALFQQLEQQKRQPAAPGAAN